MRLLILSRYGRQGASSRLRSLQYICYLEAQGVDVSVEPLFSDQYLNFLYTGAPRVKEAFKGYLRRVAVLTRVRRFDLIIVEKELFPFFPAMAERSLRITGVPYIADYDDALFHRYDLHSNGLVRAFLARKIDAVMRHATMVVAGNEYLAERARQAGASRVEVIPTVVDTERYTPRLPEGDDTPVVGWIGTPQTSRYLKSLLPVFEALQKQMPVRFVAVGARPDDFQGTPLETWSWSERTEVESIQQFDIGIMPLEDSPWERGKCGYKLIQYMACGVPVVASPVGVNKELVVPEENGLLADTPDEWERALRGLLEAGESIRQSMGAAGRKGVEERYSLKAQAPRLLAAVRGAVR